MRLVAMVRFAPSWKTVTMVTLMLAVVATPIAVERARAVPAVMVSFVQKTNTVTMASAMLVVAATQLATQMVRVPRVGMVKPVLN